MTWRNHGAAVQAGLRRAGRFARGLALLAVFGIGIGAAAARGEPPEISTSDPVLASYLAYLHARMAELDGNSDAAEAYYRAAIQSAPEPAPIYLDLGRLYKRTGEWEQALAAFRKAVKLDPDAAEAYREIGEVYEMRTLTEESFHGADAAVQAYLEYLDRIPDPDRRVISRMLSLLTTRRKTEQALEIAEKYAEKWPDNPDLWRFLAFEYAEAEKFEQAETAYRRWLDLEPRDPDAWEAWARYLLSRERVDEAVKALEQAWRLQPDNLDLMRTLVRRYRRRRRFDKALQLVKSYLQDHPDEPAAYQLMTDILADRDGPSRALAYLENLTRDRPGLDHWELKLTRLWLLYRARRYPDAMRYADDLLEALAANPSDLEPETRARYDRMIRFQKGIILFLRGDYPQAVDTIQHVEGYQNNADMVEILAEARLYQGEVNQAQELVDQARTRFPAEGDRWTVLQARIREAQGDVEGALKELQNLPTERRWREIVLLYHRRKLYDQARTYLEDLLHQAPGTGDYLYYLGSTLERLGRYDDAAQTFKKLLRQRPDHAQALNYLGYMWIDQNRHLEEGLRYVQKALELDPENPAYMDSLAWGYYRLGDLAAARQWIQRTLQRVDYDPLIWAHAGDIYEASGQLEKAVQFWVRALEHGHHPEINPDFIPEPVREKLRRTCRNHPELACPTVPIAEKPENPPR